MDKLAKSKPDSPSIKDQKETTSSTNEVPVINFSDTEIAFAQKSDAALKKAAWLFGLMNHQWLVGIGSKLGLAAIRLRLPFVETMVKHTIFEQFCGGTTLFESQKTINRLYEYNVQTILDYGVEGKETEEDFNKSMNETIRAIEFAANNDSVPVVSAKITGLARFKLLEDITLHKPFSKTSRAEYKLVLKRIDAMCYTAKMKGVALFFDAEESWIQGAIDHLVNLMMRRYNTEKVVVYNTFQMYRKDRLQFLIDSFNQAQQTGYLLGAKLVRGAYMEKERERAAHLKQDSPIHDTKEATDDAFNTALKFCLDNYEKIALCNASHNLYSNQLQAEIIAEKGLDKTHPHLNFCQLYGMSDNITYNLAKAGYNVAKYVPYGTVREVVPYLIRRAHENSSISGDMSREYKLVNQEIKRRALG